MKYEVSLDQILLAHGRAALQAAKGVEVWVDEVLPPGGEVGRGPPGGHGLALAPPAGPAGLGRGRQQLVHEGDVGDGQPQRLDPRQPLLVGKCGDLAVENLKQVFFPVHMFGSAPGRGGGEPVSKRLSTDLKD